MSEQKNIIRAWNERLKNIRVQSRWTTGLIILSSAALGGIAVAVWNRKALATFRELEGNQADAQLHDDQQKEHLDLGPEEDFF